MLPSEFIHDDIFAFFKNTLERNESGARADVDRAGAFDCQPFLFHSNQLVEDMSHMQISCKEDEKSPRVSKRLAENSLSVKVNISKQHRCCSGDHSLAQSNDLSARSSDCVHREPKKHAYIFHEYRNGASEQYYVDHELEGPASCYRAEAYMDDKLLIQPQVHAHCSPHKLNAIHGSDLGLPKPGKQHLSPLSLLNFSDLSGDLESQLGCLRQVQYNLEYLFDDFSQSVQKACSDGKVYKDLFDILNRSVLLSTDMTLPGLILPSYTETNGRKLSPVSSHSTDVSQQSQDEDHWGVPFQLNTFGIDVPSNGLSPSYFADSDSSVSWCHSSEARPNIHGTGPYLREKVRNRYCQFSFLDMSCIDP